MRSFFQGGFAIAPTLVVLAAGLGSRFGGDKQFSTLGPHGETLMDYAIFDAAQAGVARVILILRPESLAVLPSLRQRYGSAVELLAAAQRLDDLPAARRVSPGRTRPWGTAHAIRSVRHLVNGPFLVVNGDDFYGAAPYRALVAARRRDPSQWHLAGFPLGDTLSPSGPVNRALCRLGAGDMLVELEEVRGIVAGSDGERRGDTSDPSRSIAADAVVSMNMWGLTPTIFPVLEQAFRGFLERADTMDGEYYLPEAIAVAMAEGQQVRVLPARGGWCGVTYAGDAAPVRAHLARLAASGDYPAPLWP